MNCREFERYLADAGRGGVLSPEALEHLRNCEACRALLQVLQAGPGNAAEPMPTVVEGVTLQITESLRPVRPIASPAWFVVALLLAGITVALTGAAAMGFNGFHAMRGVPGAVVYLSVAGFAVVAAMLASKEMMPGQSVFLRPSMLVGITAIALAVEYSLIFRQFEIEHGLAAGIRCLELGMLHAMPAGALAWLILRRGFAVQPVSAGAAVGLVAGLGGVGFLELHCPLLQFGHRAIWHLAVIPVSAVIGAVLGAVASRGVVDRPFSSSLGE